MHRVVPELIVENYRAGRFSGEFSAVGMFLDLSGFSTMTDTLMQHGQHGAEVLASLMYGVFNPLVESIFEHGGKIVSFAGDGIMALYPIEENEKSTSLRALTSAWVIQQRLMENPDRRTVYGKFTFSARIGLAIGAVSWQILSSNDGEHATYYFRGSAVDDSAKAEHQANSGEIILTRELRDLLGEDVRTRPSGSFYRFIRFRVEMPKKTVNEFPPVDLNISKVFMPEDVIVRGVRGEFRQIANLFIRIPDIPDSELKNFVNVIFELQNRYGGLVTRLDFGDKGCNMLLLWGAPVAFENDIGRTLNFILDLRAKVEFPITAGVTYYIAHAGYLGSDLCEDYTCYGWGVNLAARFMTNAPVGEIWVDDRIAQRVSQRFALDYVGSQQFKGFAAEQKVHVLRYRKMESDVTYQGKMLGREDELRRLENFVEPLWRGEFAGVLTVSGDAGIGKGRLVHEFSASELFNSNNALWANCKADQILRHSLHPLHGWLLKYFGYSLNHSLDERKSAFSSKLDDLIASVPDGDLASELDRTRSILGALLDLDWEDSLYQQLDAEARYNNTILSLIALLKAESLRQPLILFLDDVQFTDQDTAAFLTQLKRTILTDTRSYPLGIILTLRKEGDVSPLVSEINDFEIKLDGIPRNAMTGLVGEILGGPVSQDLVIQVMVRSEGNPYFAEQVIRYLREEGRLEFGESGWVRIERGRDFVMPSDIRALLVARLDKLSRNVKNAVQTASVLGREFDLGVLSQMLGSESSTKEHVASAEKAAIWSRLNEVLYIFYHGLLRDAAYSMQMRARRQELHTLALNALEIMYEDGPNRHYAELAYHAEQGEIRSKAQRYYTLAGKASADFYQNVQAAEYYTKALAFTSFDDLETQFDILAERVELYSRMGKRDLQSSDLESLEQWAAQLKDRYRFAKVMMLRSAYHYFIGNYREAIEHANRAEVEIISAAHKLEYTKQVLYTQVVKCTSLLRLGRLDEAMKQAIDTLERTRNVKNRREEARVLNVMGLIALEQKESAPAGKYFVDALDIARENKDRDMESKALNNLAMAEGSLNGDYALAREYYRISYLAAREIGDRTGESTALGNLGFAAGMQGDFPGARSYYEQSLSISREVGNLYQEIYTLINISAMTGMVGESETALQNAQLASDLAQKTSDLSGEAWAELYMGHAYSLINEYEQAQTAYRRAIEIRNEMGQTALSMEPIAGLVDAYLQVNDAESASREAERILNFLESGATLEGTDEPLRVYYTCYCFLEQRKDPRSIRVLQQAKNLLETQVSKFKNEAERKRYIENIPWRRAIRDASLVQVT